MPDGKGGKAVSPETRVPLGLYAVRNIMFRGFRHEKSQYYGTFERARNCGTFFAEIPCVYRKNNSSDETEKKFFL